MPSGQIYRPQNVVVRENLTGPIFSHAHSWPYGIYPQKFPKQPEWACVLKSLFDIKLQLIYLFMLMTHLFKAYVFRV